MFVDEDLDQVEFKSRPGKERYLADGEAQTVDLPTQEVACQSIKRKHREVQTEDGSQTDVQMVDDTSPELLQFLNHIVPEVIRQLDRNLRSHAFDGYDVSWEDKTDTVSTQHTLNYTGGNDLLQVTGLSWNSTGATIGASYGRFDHEDWCTHRSSLCTWNLDRRNLNPNKPDSTIDVPSCLMCLAFHPKNPSWLAGGTFNGEVLVWDLSREDDPIIATSGIGDDSHREPVSKVQWLADPKGKKYQVVSVAGDGKILIWRISSSKQALKLVDGFILLTESLPRGMRMRAKRGDQEMGVTCISYLPMDSSTFLVGSESGGMFKCSNMTRGTTANSMVTSSVTLQSPVTFTFTPHNGPVYGIDASPYHRNLFLSCGTDTSARIYTMLQMEPLITLEPGNGYLYSARWSPVRPLVFAVGTEDGHLLVYDLKHHRGAPKYKLEANHAKEAVFSLQFNQHRPDLLATGDGGGTIKIWKLSDELVTLGGRETDILEDIAAIHHE